MRGSQRVNPKQHVQGSDLEAMYSHSYPQCASMCQVIRQCIYANSAYVWFQRWNNERLSPVTLAIFLIHVSYNMITNTQKKCTRTPTYNKGAGFCFVCVSVASFPQQQVWVAWHRHSIPGSPQAALGREAHHHSVFPGEWQGVTVWWGGKSGGEAIDLRPVVDMVHISTSAPVATQIERVEDAHTQMHTHSGNGYWDGQSCHQWLPSCHSDMERLGPYECLCSPKRCLGAGVWETQQSLLMRGHNQMWKLSCTLTGSIVVKGTARCNIDAVFQLVR